VNELLQHNKYDPATAISTLQSHNYAIVTTKLSSLFATILRLSHWPIF